MRFMRYMLLDMSHAHRMQCLTTYLGNYGAFTLCDKVVLSGFGYLFVAMVWNMCVLGHRCHW